MSAAKARRRLRDILFFSLGAKTELTARARCAYSVLHRSRPPPRTNPSLYESPEELSRLLPLEFSKEVRVRWVQKIPNTNILEERTRRNNGDVEIASSTLEPTKTPPTTPIYRAITETRATALTMPNSVASVPRTEEKGPPTIYSIARQNRRVLRLESAMLQR